MLAAISPVSFPSAMSAIAGVGALYALHHLRIQPNRRLIATLIFWQQATRPQQARVFWSKRFTHKRTFILLTSIVVLSAMAMTADRWTAHQPDDAKDVMVIDSGDAMASSTVAGPTVLSRAIDAARADLRQMSASPAMISAGPNPIMLSDSGEPKALAARQLSAITPQAGASASALAIELAASVQGDHAGHIYWYTTERELPPGLPQDAAGRVIPRIIEPAPAVAVVGVSFVPDDRNDAHGTLKVRIAGQENGVMTLEAQVKDTSVVGHSFSLTRGRAEVAFGGIPSNGNDVELRLKNAAGASSIHTATFRLPIRQPLTFRFVGPVPNALKLALLASGTETADGDIVVAADDARLPTDAKAAIIVVNATRGIGVSRVLALAGGGPLVQGISLENATIPVAPDKSLAGTALLTADDTVVASLDSSNDRKTLRISSVLLGDSAELPRRAAFPVLLNRICAALADGQPASPVVSSLRRAEDPLWKLPTASTVAVVADSPVLPSIDARATAPFVTAAAHHVLPWTDILLAGATTLLVVESFLLASRKIV